MRVIEVAGVTDHPGHFDHLAQRHHIVSRRAPVANAHQFPGKTTPRSPREVRRSA